MTDPARRVLDLFRRLSGLLGRVSARKTPPDVDAVLAAFREAANVSGSPRGLIWDRVTAVGPPRAVDDDGRPAMLLAVEVDFRADDSGDMDDAPGLDLTRAATLVLRRHAGRWAADEKPLFNLSPDDVIARSAGRYAPR